MCGGLEYRYINPDTGEVVVRKVFFPIPKAQVPVMEEDGSISLCRWGKRQGEDPGIDVPVTGWARLISLKEGKWNRYQPRKVRIPAMRWMEKDAGRQSHWFDLEPKQGILGVEIQAEGERFVYVVTKPSAGAFAEVHERMPMLTEVKASQPEG